MSIKAANEVQKNMWYGWLKNTAMQLNTIKGSAACSEEEKDEIIEMIRSLQQLASKLDVEPGVNHSCIRKANDLKDTEEFIGSVKEYFGKKKSA